VPGGTQPAWANTVGTPRRRRWPYRLAGLVAVATAVAVAVLITIGVSGDDNNGGVPAKVARQAQAATDANPATDPNSGDQVATDTAASGGTGFGLTGVDLTKGAVFLQSTTRSPTGWSPSPAAPTAG
jgi:hypothetical protein